MDRRSKIGDRSIDQADGIPLFPARMYTGKREDVSVNGLGVYFPAI